MNLYTATEQSSNTVYMDLQTKLGIKKIADTAREAGVENTSLDGSEPYTVLGGNNGLSVEDMTRMRHVGQSGQQADAAYRGLREDAGRIRPVC